MTALASAPAATPEGERRAGRGLSTGMPLLVLLYGFPLWWVLGFGELGFMVAALPMGLHLWRIRRALTAPKGFAIWLFFLLLVLVSALTLPARAPFAVGPGNILTYGFRLGWYLSVTIVLLYVGNLAPQWVRSRRIPNAVAFMFLVTVAGGLLGMLAPDWEANSVLGQVLPSGLAKNPFVSSLVTLDAADTQELLGYAEARPKAPFAYANSWGASFSAFLPFFLYSWCRKSSGWRLLVAPWVLVAAAFVVVATLNRALWATLVVGAIYAGVQVIRLRGFRGFVMVYGASVAGVVLVIVSGLGSTVVQRLDNPHSDDRRSELAVKTVESVVAGSPLIGFGNTRDVKGNFDSIAGGGTVECKACGVPPFGTQGQLWLVLFAQGVFGAIAFVGFFLYRMSRHLLARDTRTVILLATPLFLLIQIPFYDTLGIPLFTAMIALGLMWRAKEDAGFEQRSRAPASENASKLQSDSVPARDITRRVVRGAPIVAAGGLCVGLIGGIVAMLIPVGYQATVDVLVNPAPVVLSLDTGSTRNITVDTEAQLALSDEIMDEVASATGDPDPRSAVRVSAYPGTKVLRLTYTAADAALAEQGASAFSAAYVRQRGDYLEKRADSALDRLLPVPLQEESEEGILASGQIAKQARAAALANREAWISDVISSSPVAAETVRGPEATQERRNVAAIVGNALALGMLIALAIAGLVGLRRGRAGKHV